MEFIKRNVKIFILSGKARSGKDTVASIIKNYYSDKKVIVISFAHYIKDYAMRISNWDGSEENKPRDLLQQLGIELVKNKIDDKLFIRRVLEDIEVFSYFYDVIIIDDARLVDEIEVLKSKYNGAITIRVLRDNYDNKLTNNQKNHLTEIGLDNYTNFDYVITNINQEKLIKDVNSILEGVYNE